jgi:hypothetical protein
MGEPAATTRDKALALNRDPTTYGTIAEIGAGQEVARWLFHVGGAAGTVAKTISAYDMAVSDGLYYQDLPGGVLESTGRLFKRSVKMYVYPTRDPASGQVESVETAAVPPPWHHVRDLLLEMGRIEPIRRYDERFLSVRPHDVLALIQAGDPGWVRLVPPTVAEIIRAERLFGYTGA